jgi:hypothetical protein
LGFGTHWFPLVFQKNGRSFWLFYVIPETSRNQWIFFVTQKIILPSFAIFCSGCQKFRREIWGRLGYYHMIEIMIAMPFIVG